MRNKCEHCRGSMETDAICWAQQCCVLLANNVAFVCTGLDRGKKGEGEGNLSESPDHVLIMLLGNFCFSDQNRT